jgi:hypothetical protein
MQGKIILLILLLAGTAAAYDNSSMTDEFNKVLYGSPIQGILQSYENQLGGWIYVILALAPFTALYLYQHKLTIASIWLVSCLAAYNQYLPSVPAYVYYLVIVAWVTVVILKASTPIFTS